mgnify:CR=1 FL=1
MKIIDYIQVRGALRKEGVELTQVHKERSVEGRVQVKLDYALYNIQFVIDRAVQETLR